MQVCKKWGHILVDISLHQGRLFVVSYNMKCYILNVEMYIYCFILLFHRAGKPPPGLHLDCMKDGKMIQVIKYLNYLKHMIVQCTCTWTVVLQCGIHMQYFFTSATLIRWSISITCILRSCSVLLKHLTILETWNLCKMCVSESFPN